MTDDLDQFVALAAHNISPHATTQTGNLVVDLHAHLAQMRHRVKDQDLALADLRAEIRTLGNTLARAESALWREQEELNISRRALRVSLEDAMAAREMTLWEHVKVWWSYRASRRG